MGYWSNQNVPAYPNFNPYTNYYNDNTSSHPNYSWGSNNYPTQPPNFYQQQPAYQSPSFQNTRPSQSYHSSQSNIQQNDDSIEFNNMLRQILDATVASNERLDRIGTSMQMIQESWQQEDADCAERAENPEISDSTDRSTISTDRLESAEQKQEVSADRSLLQPIGQNFRTADFEIFESVLGCSDTAGEESDSDLSSEYSERSADTGLGWSEWEKYASAVEYESTVDDEEENTPTEDATPTLVRYTDVDFIFPSFQVPCQLSEFAIKFYAEMSYGKARSRDFPYRPYNFSKTRWHKILIRESHGRIKKGVYQRTGSISGALFDWLVWVATKVKLPKLMIRET